MTTVKIKEINRIAKDLVANMNENKKLTVSGYSWAETGYLLASSVLKPGKDIEKITVKYAPDPSGKYISRSIYEKDYKKIAKYFVDFCKKNKRLPNYIQWGSYTIHCHLLIYAFAKIVKYYASNKKLPNYCNFNSNDIKKVAQVSTDDVFNYFVKIFGKVSTIDEALGKIKDRGYGYYYDDKYGNKEAIDRIKNNWGINCTDSCQVFWHIAKALGYEVQCLHVKCSDGDGHVRLKLRHKKYSDNEWFLRDPAAVLSNNGKPVSFNWCTSGFTLLATNPNWFLANVNR